jgi:L-lysine 2,3-aminomutase
LVVYYTKDGVSGTGFLTVDSTATQNSNNPITSGYVYTLSTSIAGKADVATTVSNVAYTTRTLEKTINGSTTTVFTADNTPTQNSNNPITSGAVYIVLDDTINTVLESVLGGNS